MTEPAKSDSSKTAPIGSTKKKTDGFLVATIVIFIIALICFVICLSILFSFGNRADLQDKRGSLLASGAMIMIALIAAIIAAILLFLYLGQKSKGKENKNLGWAILGTSIASAVFLMIGLVIGFVTANQVRDEHPSEASGITAASAFGLIAFVFLVVGFIMFLVQRRQKQSVDTGGSASYGKAMRGLYSKKE